jgi:hypothetical protein
MSIINLVMLLLVTTMEAFISQLNPMAMIIRLTLNYRHNYRNKATLVTIVQMEWSLIGARLVLMEMILPVMTATRSRWVMRMAVLLVLVASIIGREN